MEDELEDKVLYQTYASHMKLISKFAVGIPTGFNTGTNTPIGYLWRIMRLYILKPEILVCGLALVLVLFSLQTVDLWSRTLLDKIQYSFGWSTSTFLVSSSVNNGEKLSWELTEGYISAYAVQGRRARMEDRFVVNDNINGTGVSLFAIFDGHGGEFAADYARDKLIPNINDKIIELKNIIAGTPTEFETEKIEPTVKAESKNDDTFKKGDSSNARERRKSFRKTMSTSLTDESIKNYAGITDPELLSKLDSLTRPITREVRPSRMDANPSPKINAAAYIDGDNINYARLLTDEVLAVDRLLIDGAKKNMDIAGTTALIALLEDSKLIVANVGDSRGVMCDGKGNAIPLSFDHKPQQQRESKRIKEAGGFIAFNGVWRVAGILATSRALGDYPLKDKKLVIADPDILSFDLTYHNPMFLILASDGLWDTFSNEEAVAFIKEHINEPYYGAKSITLQSYYRGSLDNITVVVINLKDRKYSVATAKRT
ncbi:protein phosphatase 1L-like isoform X2 [Athalia rosae]|uniref:protein phosphatase 1L-like isoform X2 n=1 Tax=Athalia rosae TaxID=37344 RepID=UPI002033B7F8|nr:protein phosphatase 1L-like isoform X2 [Athalia rosae]